MVKAKKLRRDEQSGLLLIDRPEDVPEFASDADEVAFWDTHTFSERFWRKAKHIPFDELTRLGSHRSRPGWIKLTLFALSIGLVFGLRTAARVVRH